LCIEKFNKRLDLFQLCICTICNERKSIRHFYKDLITNFNEDRIIKTSDIKCLRCIKDTNNPKKFSYENFMWFDNIPDCLRILSMAENLLISQVIPCV